MAGALRRLAWPAVLLAALAALLLGGRALVDRRSAPVAAPAQTTPAGVGIRGLLALPDDGRAPIIAELQAARTSIDVEVYLLSDRAVIDALLAAEDRGVRVRVILDPQPYGGAGDQQEVVRYLEAGGVEVRWGPGELHFTHVKMIVVDRAVALILTLNLAEGPFTDNRDLGVVTTVPSDVEHAAAIFETDWRGDAAPPSGPLVVSPVDSRSRITALIAGATSTLDLYAEVVRDEASVDALVAAATRGVAVRLVLPPETDPAFAPLLGRMLAGGVKVRFLAAPTVHAKAVLADGRDLFVGSQNLTATSLDANREVGIVVGEPEMIVRFTSVFDRDWAAAEPAGSS